MQAVIYYLISLFFGIIPGFLFGVKFYRRISGNKSEINGKKL